MQGAGSAGEFEENASMCVGKTGVTAFLVAQAAGAGRAGLGRLQLCRNCSVDRVELCL